MEREIKFRGKRTKAGDPLERWIEGSLCRYTNIYDETVTRIMSPSGHMNDVRPETVGQFTGLHDTGGREIYEGDIVTWLTGRDGVGFMEVGRVEWRSNEGCYIVVNRFLTRDNREIVQPLIRCTRDIKVRGNIFDSPELLEGGEG